MINLYIYLFAEKYKYSFFIFTNNKSIQQCCVDSWFKYLQLCQDFLFFFMYTVEPPLTATSEERPLSTKRPVAQVRIEFTITYALENL